MDQDSAVRREDRVEEDSRFALEALSREGARRMLQAALENEVAEYLAEHAHPRGWYIKRGQVIPPTESAKTADP